MKVSHLLAALVSIATARSQKIELFPPNKAKDVNPDTHLVLKFPTPPAVGDSGFVKVYDAADWSLVDRLNMSVPASPNPSGRTPSSDGSTTAPRPNPSDLELYQTNIIGGVDFYFFPIIVRGNTATIYLHNNKLKYGHTYVVQMDEEILLVEESEDYSFGGISGCRWTFTTKERAPESDSALVVVTDDGSGDFNTVQGALDWTPASPHQRVTISIKNGFYEELIYVQNKTNITIQGQSRNETIVGYPNNSAFNPSRGGPSRRPAFTMNNVADIQLSDFTINNYFIGQAEALLLRGERLIVDQMTLNGSGDAFTTYGTIYFVDSLLIGDGDTVLGYAAVFWHRSEIRSIGPVTWTRTPEGSHGNVFLDCTIIGRDEPLPWTVTPSNPEGQKVPAVFARLPYNGGGSAPNFPFAEMVLINTRTENITAEAWGAIQSEPEFDWTNVKFWEYNTVDLQGNKVDMSQRHPIARELFLPEDKQIIKEYSDPSFVLDGWTPEIHKLS